MKKAFLAIYVVCYSFLCHTMSPEYIFTRDLSSQRLIVVQRSTGKVATLDECLGTIPGLRETPSLPQSPDELDALYKIYASKTHYELMGYDSNAFWNVTLRNAWEMEFACIDEEQFDLWLKKAFAFCPLILRHKEYYFKTEFIERFCNDLQDSLNNVQKMLLSMKDDSSKSLSEQIQSKLNDIFVAIGKK